MHLGLYRTTLAAASRLINEFCVPREISCRVLSSSAGGNKANSHMKISDKGWRRLKSTDPLSTNKGHAKSKRRTRIDLVTCSIPKPKVAQNICRLGSESSNFGTCPPQKSVVKILGPLQCESSDLIIHPNQNSEKVDNNAPLHFEASTPISDFYDTDLPTNFGKKLLSSSARIPKLCQTYHEPREDKRRSKPSSSIPIDEPFDICHLETLNKRNRWMGSLNRQLDEDNKQNISPTEIENCSLDLREELGYVLRPGMVLLKHYIPLLEQVKIVNKCRELGCGPGGFYQPGYNDGAKLRLQMMCLGLDWDPQTRSYGERRHHDNAAPRQLPCEFASLVCRALDDSHDYLERNLKVGNVEDVLPRMSPDVCIVNFYTSNGRLGLHQDRDESDESLRKGLPIVSVSIGDSAEFLYGNERDVKKAESVLLESGDVLLFGGECRLIFHGVKAIIPDTAPPELLKTTGLRPGRLNLTFRKS